RSLFSFSNPTERTGPMRQMMKNGLVIASVFAVLILHSYTAAAADNDINIPAGTTQQDFKDLTEELGLAISYMPLAPAEPLGLLGFDGGVEISFVNLDQSKPVWAKVVSDGSIPDYVPFPKLHAQVGLPLNLDVGVVYSKVPDSNISMIGGELKWAFIGGGVAM